MIEGGRKRRTGSPQDMRERERQRERQRETERQRHRHRHRHRERGRQLIDVLGMYYKRSQFCAVVGLFAVPSGTSYKLPFESIAQSMAPVLLLQQRSKCLILVSVFVTEDVCNSLYIVGLFVRNVQVSWKCLIRLAPMYLRCFAPPEAVWKHVLHLSTVVDYQFCLDPHYSTFCATSRVFPTVFILTQWTYSRSSLPYPRSSISQ